MFGTDTKHDETITTVFLLSNACTKRDHLYNERQDFKEMINYIDVTEGKDNNEELKDGKYRNNNSFFLKKKGSLYNVYRRHGCLQFCCLTDNCLQPTTVLFPSHRHQTQWEMSII